MKHKLSWKQARSALAGQPAQAPRETDTFWEDFRARAGLHPQHHGVAARPARIYLWAAAAACAMLMLAVLGTWTVMQRSAVSGAGTTIRSLDIGADHQGVVVIADRPSQGTILWVVGMETPGENSS